MSDEKDTQLGEAAAATAGEAAATPPQETPEVNELRKQNQELSKQLTEHKQVLDSILLRQREIDAANQTPTRKAEDELNIKIDTDEMERILELPPKEAAKKLAEVNASILEATRKALAKKDEEIVNKVKKTQTLDAAIEKGRSQVLKDYPHLEDELDEICMKAADVFHKTPGMDIPTAIKKVADERNKKFVQFASQKKAEEPPAKLPPGAVSETAGVKTPAKAPPAKDTAIAPGDTAAWIRQQKQDRLNKNKLR